MWIPEFPIAHGDGASHHIPGRAAAWEAEMFEDACNLNPKLAKARVAALQIAGEQIPQELIDAANQTGKLQEEAPVVWEGRGEQSSPLNQKEVPKPKEDRKRTRDDGREPLRRRGRRRRDSRDRERRRSRSRPAAERKEAKETPVEKKTFGKKVAASALHSEGQEEEAEDEVEAVPNTELLVLGSSESYSYEWSGDEEEIIKAKAARQAAKEERRRKLEERRAELQRKADEERQKADEEQRAEAERKAEEERQEAERRAAEAKAREAEAEAKRKADEDIALVRSSSQDPFFGRWGIIFGKSVRCCVQGEEEKKEEEKEEEKEEKKEEEKEEEGTEKKGEEEGRSGTQRDEEGGLGRKREEEEGRGRKRKEEGGLGRKREEEGGRGRKRKEEEGRGKREEKGRKRKEKEGKGRKGQVSDVSNLEF
eukprot:s722_g17.t1